MSPHDSVRAGIIAAAITPEQIALTMFRASRGTRKPPSLEWCHQHVCAALNGRIGISDAVAFFATHLKVENEKIPHAASLG